MTRRIVNPSADLRSAPKSTVITLMNETLTLEEALGLLSWPETATPAVPSRDFIDKRDGDKRSEAVRRRARALAFEQGALEDEPRTPRASGPGRSTPASVVTDAGISWSTEEVRRHADNAELILRKLYRDREYRLDERGWDLVCSRARRPLPRWSAIEPLLSSPS